MAMLIFSFVVAIAVGVVCLQQPCLVVVLFLTRFWDQTTPSVLQTSLLLLLLLLLLFGCGTPKIENEKESGDQVSQHGTTWQQCVVLPMTFRSFLSARTDPTRVAAL
jgi:hypothetical protein